MATTSKSATKPKTTPKAAPAKAVKAAAAKPKTTAPVSKTAAKPKVAVSAKAAPKKSPAKPKISPEQYRAYVEVAAYHIAERRGFQGGDALGDWAQAEAEIDRLLSEGILKP